jgi:hypothetical protein
MVERKPRILPFRWLEAIPFTNLSRDSRSPDNFLVPRDLLKRSQQLLLFSNRMKCA